MHNVCHLAYIKRFDMIVHMWLYICWKLKGDFCETIGVF